MLSRKGFTLVELMVVILIVAILAAVAIPIMRGRIDAAKWSEGKAIMGTIATAIRAYMAEKNPPEDPAAGNTFNFDHVSLPATELGFNAPTDLVGTYFPDPRLFTWNGTYQKDVHSLTFTVQALKGPTIGGPDVVTLNEKGEWGTGGP